MRKTGVECYIGVGGYYHLKDLPLSYEEALKALRDNDGQLVTHIKDVKSENSMELEQYNAIGKDLLAAFEAGNEEKTFIYLNKIYDAISALPTHDQPNKCIEIMVLIYRKAYEMEVKGDTVIDYSSYLEEMIGHEKEEIQRWSIRKIKYLISKINEMNTNKVSKAVLEAKRYIDIHYGKELTLEEISRVVSVSPQYFSKLFKEETGFNFIEYLTNSRIEKAKELIKNTQMTMKEVCFEVGYNDPNYFSRLFKKIVGVSPTDYLKKV
jgi:two-component system response regulator YesN